jgi:hypothetical protein
MAVNPWDLAILPQPVSYGPNQNAETLMFGTDVPANYLSPGMVVHLAAKGIVTTVSGQPVLVSRIRMGPVTMTGAILDTLTLFTSNNQTNKSWSLDALLTVQPDGVSIWGQADLASNVSTQFQFGWIGSDQTAAVAFDPTVANRLELTADWDDLDANIWKITQGKVTVHGPV